MNLTRILVALLCTLSLSTALAKQHQLGLNAAGYPIYQVSDIMQVQQLADGLWLHRSEQQLSSGARFTHNGLIVQAQGGVILIDTGWGDFATLDLLRFIESKLQQPVLYAIASHFHDDSLGGYKVLAQRQIPLRVTAQTAALAASQNTLPVAIATRLNVGEHFDDGELDWFYPGAGHAPDNIVIYLPKYQLLFGGCFVKAPKYPGLGNIADADLAAWPASLLRVKAAYPSLKLLVPGHGDISDSRLLDYSLQLLHQAANPSTTAVSNPKAH